MLWKKVRGLLLGGGDPEQSLGKRFQKLADDLLKALDVEDVLPQELQKEISDIFTTFGPESPSIAFIVCAGLPGSARTNPKFSYLLARFLYAIGLGVGF